ncbi:DUF6111 family protein [Terrihabitans sp. B22-R8]|uniref:DUF6111 family protein n=1 Tax=Terrihabitans sp. B22-R8 TaxID=3425128 RepID=UPI00403CE6FF
MIRAILPSLLLFLLPFAVYFLWAAWQRRVNEGSVPAAPYAWIAMAGLVLAIGGFLFFVDFTSATPEGVYVPSRYEDGKLAPGHFVPHGTPAR